MFESGNLVFHSTLQQALLLERFINKTKRWRCRTLLDKHVIKAYPNELQSIEIQTHFDDKLWLVPDLFDRNICDSLISQANSEYWPIKQSGNRTCLRRVIYDKTLSKNLFEIVEKLDILPKNVDGWVLQNLAERMVFVRYEKGHQFGQHVDYTVHEGECKSLYTFMIYLNEEFEGGELVFPLSDFDVALDPSVDVKLSVIPSSGLCCVFQQNDAELIHQALPLIDGVKYILRGNILYENFNNWFDSTASSDCEGDLH